MEVSNIRYLGNVKLQLKVHRSSNGHFKMLGLCKHKLADGGGKVQGSFESDIWLGGLIYLGLNQRKHNTCKYTATKYMEIHPSPSFYPNHQLMLL